VAVAPLWRHIGGGTQPVQNSGNHEKMDDCINHEKMNQCHDDQLLIQSDKIGLLGMFTLIPSYAELQIRISELLISGLIQKKGIRSLD
jgi:hypothetical protein